MTLSDAGPPFNPLAQAMNPRRDRTTPPGGQGLTLVWLMASSIDYQRTREGNRLQLSVPFSQGAESGGEGGATPSAPRTLADRLKHRCSGSPMNFLRALWQGHVAVRQTVLFTLSSMVLIWGAMALYALEISNQRTENARQLVRQAMHMQATISTAFVNRVSNSLEQLGKAVQALPHAEVLLANPDELVRQLQQRGALRAFLREYPVLGVVFGYGHTAWLYNMRQGKTAALMGEDLYKQAVDGNLTSLVGHPARWEPLFMTFLSDDRHASMLYARALAPSEKAEDGWVGVIITMTWITDTLYAVSGVTHAAPFYTDSTGRYVIFPPGRALGNGPQRLSEELSDGAATPAASQTFSQGTARTVLVEAEADMLAGTNNAVQLPPPAGRRGYTVAACVAGAHHTCLLPHADQGLAAGVAHFQRRTGQRAPASAVGAFLSGSAGAAVRGADYLGGHLADFASAQGAGRCPAAFRFRRNGRALPKSQHRRRNRRHADHL